MKEEHICKREDLDWEKEPRKDTESICYRGKCPVCGKKYEQVFSENEGLWDVKKEKYVYI